MKGSQIIYALDNEHRNKVGWGFHSEMAHLIFDAYHQTYLDPFQSARWAIMFILDNQDIKDPTYYDIHGV